MIMNKDSGKNYVKPHSKARKIVSWFLAIVMFLSLFPAGSLFAFYQQDFGGVISLDDAEIADIDSDGVGAIDEDSAEADAIDEDDTDEDGAVEDGGDEDGAIDGDGSDEAGAIDGDGAEAGDNVDGDEDGLIDESGVFGEDEPESGLNEDAGLDEPGGEPVGEPTDALADGEGGEVFGVFLPQGQLLFQVFVGEVIYVSSLIEEGETAPYPALPPQSMYPASMVSFLGWYEEGAPDSNPYDFTSPIMDNLTLYAR